MRTHPKPRFERGWVWRLLAILVLPVLSWLVKFRFTDAEKLPKQGAFVLAPNHYSEIDPIIMGAAVWKLGRVPRFLAKASLWKIPVVRSLLTASGQIPVERTGGSRAADPLAAARTLVSQQSAVIIYPEGSLTRDPDLWPMRGKTGAVRMALQAGIPLIPAAHWGTQHVMPRYGKRVSFWPPRKRIDVVIGDPVDLSEFAGRPLDAKTLQEATAKVMDAIAGLLAGLRGEPAPAERWDPARANQSETGRFE